MTTVAAAFRTDSDAYSKRVLGALEDAVSRLKELDRARHEPIAIVGIGCRFPGKANDLESFQQLLFSRGDAIGRVPASRWDADAFYDADFAKPGRMYVREGAFLDRIEDFDAEFFGISHREAMSLDPQHRILLEVSWEALENAGIRPSTLEGTPTGVFIGITCSDYARRLAREDYGRIDSHFATGNTLNASAGRISYFLGLQGPSLAIDTACSSSLVAVHLACQSLRAGECSVALAGGVNLILSPEGSIAACRARMLAPDGRSKTFDAAADGYGRGEGCGVVVLKRLSDALAAGDLPHALIRGSAVNQDGASGGLTVPNGPAQQKLIAQALSAARVEPEQVAYLETHGTGTSLGDPIEYRAAVASYGTARARPLIVGAVKANIGHLEAAAGIAGLIKTALVLQRRLVPPQIHFNVPNPHIPWDELPAKVPTSAEPLEETARFASVSSFGASGTNAHAILEATPGIPAAASAPRERSKDLLVLSAKTSNALREIAGRYAEFIRERADVSLSDLCYSAASTRDIFAHRLAILATTKIELAEKLEQFREGGVTVLGIFFSDNVANGPPPDDPLARQALDFVLAGAVSPLLPGERGRIRLPGYAWQWERFWPEPAALKSAPASAIDDWFYEPQWRRKPLPASRAAELDFPTPSLLQTRLAKRLAEIRSDPEVREYEEFIESLERASTDYIVAALEQLGWDWSEGSCVELSDFTRTAGVRHDCARLLRRLLQILQEDGVVRASGGSWKVMSARRVNEIRAAGRMRECCERTDSPESQLLHRCGSRLAAVLTGRSEPLSILFPADGSVSAEKLYSDALGARILNGLASEALRYLLAELPAECPVRVLEIGAGTGSATAKLLPMFDPQRARYTVTDITPLLVNRTQERFRHFGFVDFALLDIERPPDSQGFERQAYDLVIAASVIHATQDIAASVRHARQLLRPGGILILLELTGQLRFIDLIFGLTEGWWRFSDGSLRQHHPLISSSEWKCVLEANGFSECVTLGTNDPGDGILSKQALVIAQADHPAEICIETNQHWLLLGDRGGIAKRVAQLFPMGMRHTLVSPEEALNLVKTSRHPIAGIVNFRPCDGTIAESASTKEVAPACELAVRSALDLLQALVSLQEPQPVPLYFVTQDFAPVPTPVSAGLAQSPLWGMLKSVALEYPAWKLTCIDLPHNSSTVELQAFVDELRDGGAEREVVLREHRWVSRLVRVAVPSQPAFSVSGKATYLITGGTRGLGPALAHWLSQCGAAHLALLGRREPNEESQRTLDRVRALGTQVEIFRADVAAEDQLRVVLAKIESDMPPLRGVIHGAGTLDDALLAGQNWGRFNRVLRPKVEGAWNLHRLTGHLPLDFFVMFSSIASLFGSPGQSNHSAANAFLDALAHYRRSLGLAALSINWGPWSELGAAAQLGVHNRLRGSGVGGITTAAGLQALERCLASRAVQLGIVDIDWQLFREQFAVDRRTTWFETLAKVPTRAPDDDDIARRVRVRTYDALARRVREADAAVRPEVLCQYVESRVREVLGVPATHALLLQRPLLELGLDSLMSTELKNRFVSELGIDLPIQTLLVGGSISEVARQIGERFAVVQSAGDCFDGSKLELEEINL